MDEKQREIEHYRAAAIAARAAADQFRIMAERGKPKSPGNVANVVLNAWVRALERARKADAVASRSDLDACLRESVKFVAGLKDAKEGERYVRMVPIEGRWGGYKRLEIDDATLQRIKFAAQTILDSGVLGFDHLPYELYSQATDIIDREMADGWNCVPDSNAALIGAVKDVMETMSRLQGK